MPGDELVDSTRASDALELPRVCVAYLCRDHKGARQVLLGRKKRGFGIGYVVGLGGKFEPGETAEEAVVREIREEAGVEVAPGDLDRRGDLNYVFPSRPAWSQRSTVFVVRKWAGDPVPSDELDPVWFDVASLPVDEMWHDARFWLPGVLAGGQVSREFSFADDLATVALEGTFSPRSA